MRSALVGDAVSPEAKVGELLRLREVSNSVVGYFGFSDREQLEGLGPGQVLCSLVTDLRSVEVEPFELGEFCDDGHVLVTSRGFLEGEVGELREVGKELEISALEGCPVEDHLDHLALFMEEPAAKRFDLLLRAVEMSKGKDCGGKPSLEAKESGSHACWLNRTAKWTAAFKLLASAFPCQAMSKAVP